MFKMDYIRRQPGILDYNRLVDAINLLIDKVETKKEIIPVVIEREVKDYSFFLGEEVELPYEVSFVLVNPDDAARIFGMYALTYKETKEINNIIMGGDIVALDVKVKEVVTEKDKKQETTFEVVEDVDLDKPVKAKKQAKKKKEGKPKKKTSWN